MRTMFIFMTLLLSLTSCCKDPFASPCDNPPCDTIPAIDTSKIKFLWFKTLFEGKNVSQGTNLYFDKGDLIVTIIPSDISLPAEVRKLSLPDLEVKWRWSGIPENYYTSEHIQEDQDVFVVSNWSRSASLNLMTGSPYWQDDVFPEKSGNPSTNLVGSYLYQTQKNINSHQNTEAHLMRRDLRNSQSWDTIYSLYREDVNGFRPNIESVAYWQDPNSGDSILVFQHRMVIVGSIHSRNDIIAWNLSKDELLWRVDSFPVRSFNVKAPIIHHNIALFMTGKSIYAFDLILGKLIYTTTFEESNFINFTGSYANIYDNTLIVWDVNGTLIAGIDPSTGQTRWKHVKESSYSGSAQYASFVRYGPYLINGNFNQLDVIRISDGKIMYQLYNTGWLYKGRMVLDEEKRLLYAATEKHIICYQLPEDF